MMSDFPSSPELLPVPGSPLTSHDGMATSLIFIPIICTAVRDELDASEMESPRGMLPAEIICKILCFLDPLDVVRLRTVSKQLRDITYDSAIWKTLYANARLPRPPGPFLHQSVSFLERTLIQSAQLVKSWTTERIRDVRAVQVRFGGLARGFCQMINGRWLVSCESFKQFALHDIESPTSPPKVIWEFEGTISSWDITYVTSSAGERVYVVFSEKGSEELHTPWKLLEFQLNSEAGELYDCVSLDVPTWNFREPVMLHSVRLSPFIYIEGQELIFDTQTRLFYRFPVFSTELDIGPPDSHVTTPFSVLTTNTHVIALFPASSQLHSSLQLSTHVQVFALPADPKPAADNTCVLRLTHEGIIPNEIVKFTVIGASTVDSTTGSTRSRFLQIRDHRNSRDFLCVDFTLSKWDSNLGVLPISFHTHHLFTVDSGDHHFPSYADFIEFSEDGYIRGISLRYLNLTNDFDSVSSSLATMKFTIDVSGDECTGVGGEVEQPEWTLIDGIPPFSMLSFDGVRGRICCSKTIGSWTVPSHVDVLVVDIK